MYASWRNDLEAARHRGRRDPTSRYAQLATVAPDGHPRCRTVVVRRVDDDAIVFVTDARSAKVADLDHEPWAELCWYFRDARAQFRLAGKVAPLDAAETSALWEAMSEAGRRSFAWPPPGAPLADPDAFEVEAPATPPDTFLALRLEVHAVDELELRPSPHRRRRYERVDGTWRAEPVNP